MSVHRSALTNERLRQLSSGLRRIEESYQMDTESRNSLIQAMRVLQELRRITPINLEPDTRVCPCCSGTHPGHAGSDL